MRFWVQKITRIYKYILDFIPRGFQISNRVVGAFLIYIVITEHFNIEFNMLHSLLLGLGIGLML